jgi:transglutaminase-like putative cysteine protease
MRQGVTILDVFRVCLLLTVALALCAYALAERAPGLAVAMVVPAVAGWYFTEWRRRGESVEHAWGLPRLAANVLLLGVLGGASLRAWETGEFVSAFSAFLCAIVVLKLWEKREASDYGQLLTMSAFLAVGAVLTGTSLPMGLALVLMVPCLAAAAMLFQILESERQAGIAGKTAWRSVSRPFSVVAGLSLLAGVVVSVVLFIVVPRGIGQEQFGRWGGVAIGRTTGFTNQVDLSRGGLISESQTTVMDVRLFSEGMDRNIGGEGLPLHMRGVVLSTYERGRWHRGDTLEIQRVRRQSSQPLAFDTTDAAGNERVLEVTPRRAGSRSTPIFTVNRPKSVELIDLSRATDVLLETGPAVIGGLEGGWPRVYQVRYAMRGASRSELAAAMGSDENVRREISFPVARVRTTAARILRDAGIEPDPSLRERDADAGAARAIESYMRANFTYTLEGPVAPLRDDPTDWFIHEGRAGHCEHFASAMAALCRGVGIDSRVVAGYLAGEFDESTGSYIVREADAHAWVEAEVGVGRWETFDPTPPSELSALQTAQRRSFLTRVARLFDAVQATWDGSIISFDQGARERLLGGGSGSAGWVDSSLWNLATSLRPLRERMGGGPWWWGLAFVSMVVVPVTLVVLIGRAIVGWWQTRRVGMAGGWAFTPQQMRALGLMLAALRKRGHEKPAWMPLRTFAEEVAVRDPAVGSLAIGAADALMEARFNSGGAATLERARALAAQIRRVP